MELAITHFVKSGTLQNACSTRPRVVVGLGEKCLCGHRQVGEQPSERSKKNDDKSAVAMLKKGDWHESVWELVTYQSHDRPGRPDKKRDHELERGSAGRRSSNVRQLGFVFQDMKPPKPIFGKSWHAETNPTCGILENYCKSHKHSTPKSFARIYLPSWTSSAQAQRSIIWTSVSGGDRVARARCTRSSVEAGQKCIKIKGAWKSNILLTLENWCLPARNVQPEEKDLEPLMEKCKRMNRQQCMSKNCKYNWQWKSSMILQQYCFLESFSMKTGILTNGSMVKNHISSQTGFGYFAIRRTSFLLWFQACQVRPLDLHRLQRHLRDRRVISHHLLLLHQRYVKFRFENEKMGLTGTPLQCLCQLRLMIDQGNLMKPQPIKSKNK